MKLWDTYHTPTTTGEALHLLQQYAGAARIIAGGTDLLVDMRANNERPHTALVDITRIPELCAITDDADSITIGAGVTHTQIVKSALLMRHAACLVESCGVVGGPQVRNVATLGGNVAHALPAADGTTSLVALDAQVEAIIDGVRGWYPIRQVFIGTGQSVVNPSRDLLVQMRFKKAGDGEATAFSRVMRPQGVALPILGCAVWIKLDTPRLNILEARVCIAPTAPTPVRAEMAESTLIGKAANEETIEAAIASAQDSLRVRTSKYRATADYRREIIAVLLRRTLTSAFERAAITHRED